jgi:hypothetical protein
MSGSLAPYAACSQATLRVSPSPTSRRLLLSGRGALFRDNYLPFPLSYHTTAAMDWNDIRNQVSNLSVYDLKAGVRKVQNGKPPCSHVTLGMF